MQFDLNSLERTASTLDSRLNSIFPITSGHTPLLDRSSSQTPASDQDDQSEPTAYQSSILSSTPNAIAHEEDTLPLRPARTAEILGWPVTGVRYSPHRAYESLSHGTVTSALWALVCRIVREESSRGTRINYTGFLFLPGTVEGQQFPIKVTMLREVVLGMYFDLHFGVQVHTGLLPDKMRGIQNAMNKSWKTKKHLTAQAVRCVLSQKGFKVLEMSCNPPHDIIWARYRHPHSNDQHIAGYFYAASIVD